MASFRAAGVELLGSSRRVLVVATRTKGRGAISKLGGHGRNSYLQLFCTNAHTYPGKGLGSLFSQGHLLSRDRHYSQSTGIPKELDDVSFHKLSDATLDELAEFFEDLGDSGLCSSDYDVSLASGVLTINVGDNHGTYVINKQSPNRQIWFSSPQSGPKRFDVIDGRWRYSHDGVALHDLLQREMSEILGTDLDLTQLPHCHLVSDEDNWVN